MEESYPVHEKHPVHKKHPAVYWIVSLVCDQKGENPERQWSIFGTFCAVSGSEQECGRPAVSADYHFQSMWNHWQTSLVPHIRIA